MTRVAQRWLLRRATLIHSELRHFDLGDSAGLMHDVWIDEGTGGGVIREIEPAGSIPTHGFDPTRVIDLEGRWLLPGLIDAHTHLREPGLEHKETLASGSAAAVAGGFTSVACMANTLPVNDCAAITRSILARAAETAVCRVYPVGAITRGLQGRELAEIGGMIEAGAVALSDDGLPVTDSSLMRRALEYARSFGVAILSHAEDLHLSSGGCMHEGSDSFRLGLPGIPAASEEIAVARDIALCRLTGARLHLAHLSTREAIEQVRRAKRDGLPVTAEVTPHHLRLTAETWQGYSTFCKMNPPLRTAGDTAALIEALADGTIDLIATDHAPHALHEKSLDALAAPNGVIGLQTAVPLTLAPVFSGRIPLLRWVRSLTEAPARLLGIPGGRLTRGAPSDLCVIDPNERWSWSPESNRSKSPNLPPLHEAGIHSFQGRVILTFVGGRLAFDGRTNPTEARS